MNIMNSADKDLQENPPEEKSKLGVIVHSFFIIPFLIAVFCVLIFAGVRILTKEPHTVYDYIEDIKVGSLSKRWQAAFELSKILVNKEKVPREEAFVREMIAAFQHAKHDDARIRQYLGLAMGRSEIKEFVRPIEDSLSTESEENLPSLIYALGLLKSWDTATSIHDFINHPDTRIRLLSVMALGNIQNPESVPFLRKALNDTEVNVRWDAAIALAKFGDDSGYSVLRNLLDRDYLAQFPEVDSYEANEAIVVAIEASILLNHPQLNETIYQLSENDENIRVRRVALKAVKMSTDKASTQTQNSL